MGARNGGDEYDLIVIGTGPGASSLITALLQTRDKLELDPISILVIEAGEKLGASTEATILDSYSKPHKWVKNVINSRKKKENWIIYKDEIKEEEEKRRTKIIAPGTRGQQFSIYRAKLAGGCSIHNACAFVPGCFATIKKNTPLFKNIDVQEIKTIFKNIREAYQVQSVSEFYEPDEFTHKLFQQPKLKPNGSYECLYTKAFVSKCKDFCKMYCLEFSNLGPNGSKVCQYLQSIKENDFTLPFLRSCQLTLNADRIKKKLSASFLEIFKEENLAKYLESFTELDLPTLMEFFSERSATEISNYVEKLANLNNNAKENCLEGLKQIYDTKTFSSIEENDCLYCFDFLEVYGPLEGFAEQDEYLTKFDFTVRKEGHENYHRITPFQSDGLHLPSKFETTEQNSFRKNGTTILIKYGEECVKIHKNPVTGRAYQVDTVVDENNREQQFTYKIADNGYIACCGGTICTPILLYRSGLLSSDVTSVDIYDDLYWDFTFTKKIEEVEDDKLNLKLSIRPETVFFTKQIPVQSESDPNESKDVTFTTNFQIVLHSGTNGNNCPYLGDKCKWAYAKSEHPEGNTYFVECDVILSGLPAPCAKMSFKDDQNIIEKNLYIENFVKNLQKDLLQKPLSYLNQVFGVDTDLERKKVYWRSPHHLCGSCVPFVGEDNCTVQGIPNLLIGDASIIERPINGYLHVPTMIAGWRVGEVLANKMV